MLIAGLKPRASTLELQERAALVRGGWRTGSQVLAPGTACCAPTKRTEERKEGELSAATGGFCAVAGAMLAAYAVAQNRRALLAYIATGLLANARVVANGVAARALAVVLVRRRMAMLRLRRMVILLECLS